jgi:peroxiredoxin
MTLLRDRRAEFEKAGVAPYAVSRDSPWSHAAWSQALDLGGIVLLSDWSGEAVHAFGVAREYRGFADVAERSAFIVDREGIIRGSWRYASSELPDFDELLSTARSLSS